MGVIKQYKSSRMMAGIPRNFNLELKITLQGDSKTQIASDNGR